MENGGQKAEHGEWITEIEGHKTKHREQSIGPEHGEGSLKNEVQKQENQVQRTEFGEQKKKNYKFSKYRELRSENIQRRTSPKNKDLSTEN